MKSGVMKICFIGIALISLIACKVQMSTSTGNFI